jgi:enoyl-CoA hydratase
MSFAVERVDDVAVLTIDRPEKRNALSIEMRFELAELLPSLASEAGALLITGAGSAFCSGMDTTQFGGDLENRRRIVQSSIAAFGGFGRFPKPVIAAVNGPAIAGGFALALLSDIRIASHDAASASASCRAACRRATRPPGRRCPRPWRASWR